jgi:hypothetical protein
MCRVCKVEPRKSDRIIFCKKCKTKVDNCRNSYKAQNRLAEFQVAYNGDPDKFNTIVEEDAAKGGRPDGRSGKGVPRVQWDYAQYSEQQSTSAETSSGAERDYMCEVDFCEFWMKRSKCSLDEATVEWNKRKRDPVAYHHRTCKETGVMLIGVWSKQYDDARTTKKNENNLKLGMKDIKKPKDERIDALGSNLVNRLSTGGLSKDHFSSARLVAKPKHKFRKIFLHARQPCLFQQGHRVRVQWSLGSFALAGAVKAQFILRGLAKTS